MICLLLLYDVGKEDPVPPITKLTVCRVIECYDSEAVAETTARAGSMDFVLFKRARSKSKPSSASNVSPSTEPHTEHCVCQCSFRNNRKLPQRPPIYVDRQMIDSSSNSSLIEMKNKLDLLQTARNTCTKFESLNLNDQGGLMSQTLAIFEQFSGFGSRSDGMEASRIVVDHFATLNDTRYTVLHSAHSQTVVARMCFTAFMPTPAKPSLSKVINPVSVSNLRIVQLTDEKGICSDPRASNVACLYLNNQSDLILETSTTSLQQSRAFE